MQPFTKFRGTLKRLAIDEETEPARAAAFQWAFPGFLDPVATPESAGAQTPSLQTRRRRYSGGLFSGRKPLPRGRYSTVCVFPNGDDGWGLCQELRAYAGSTLQQKIFAYDLGPSPVQQLFEEKGWLIGNRLGLHFIDPDGEMLARYASIGDSYSMNAQDPTFWRTQLDYIAEEVEIDDVVDLRIPETQQWFFETFREGYKKFWKKPAGKSIRMFHQMLPSLIIADLGGGPVTDAIGLALRMMGASALVCPSARNDVETVVENGELRGWVGFNLIDFRNWGILTGQANEDFQFDDPDPWDIPIKWPNVQVQVAELSADKELAQLLKGSWRLIGVRDAHEQFWEAGGVLGGHQIGEWEKQETDHRGTFVRMLNQKLKPPTQDGLNSDTSNV